MGKKLLITLVILLLSGVSVSSERVITGSSENDVNVIVEESNDVRTVIRFEIGAFNKEAVDIDGDLFYQIRCDREGVLLNAEEPAVPRICRSLVIPDDAKMAVNVLSAEYTDFPETPVIPSKGNLLRTVNPDDISYVLGPIYTSKEWYPSELVDIRSPFILRDVRGTVIELNAFQYQHDTRTLRVYTSVTVEVISVGPGEVNVLERDQPLQSVVPDFAAIYSSRFINYPSSPIRYPMAEEIGDMLIITYDAFHDAMLPLVNWKRQKGIKTTIVDISSIGNDANQIAGYIQDFYDSTNLAFVLLVGDAAQITTLTSGGGGADPMFALVDGGDSYPDILVGRFSAESVAHVETQVERTITYELNSPGSDWFHKGTGIASTEGPGHHGEYDHEHMGFIRDSLLLYTYTEVDGFYGYSATASQVTTALNGGRSIINYCGHGSTTAWSTSGFSNSNVNALVNDDMLPFIISVACVNGKFRYYTCFGEAWMRATNSGNPTGAIGAYMSSIDQSWSPPMDAQDEVIHLLKNEVRSSYGALCFNGSCRMIEINGSGGVSIYNTWHVFGDPSVQVRTDTPASMTVNHTGAAFFNLTEYEVEVVGVEGALCALYHDGTLYGTAYTGSDGTVIIPVSEQLPIGVTVTLTVTASNKLTFVDDVIVTADLTILHDPLQDTKEIINDYEVLCTIFSESGLVADSLLLWYEINSVWYNSLLEVVRFGEDYVGYIPAQAPGTEINYYLFAKNEVDDVDSTDVFTFRVIDYGVLLDPEFATATVPVDDTILYTMTVTNDGVLDDDYGISISNNLWPTSIWDITGTTEISNTTTLIADEAFDFLVRVIVPESWEDEFDTVNVTVTSNSDGSISDAATLQTISAGQPWPIPFTESFPTTVLDMTKWESIAGTTVDESGIDEPSEPYSANFDGSPSGGDSLMSEKIDLHSETNVILKYYYERTGSADSPESGDDLTVEYVDSVGVWHLLAQHLGSELDMNEYEEVVINLPLDACHAGFRVCFHNSATIGNYDDWFVDDIFVGYPPDYDMDLGPYYQTQFGPAGDTATFGLTIYNTGILADQYDLSYSNNVWDVSLWDADGLTEITSTPTVESEDSLIVLVKVTIPAVAAPHEADTVDITVISQNDPGVTGTVFVATISAGPSIAFPMFEPFAEATLSGDRWFENHGAEISVDGLAPPSSPYSLCLDGGIDTVVSRLIDISGQDGAIISYYFEAGAAGNPPGVGENLYVEYKNTYGEWININTHLGGGPAMTTFEHVNVGLPADAIHNGFQLRLRSYGTCEDCDLWFVDDIRVDYAPDISVTPLSITEWLQQGDSSVVDMVIDNSGPGGLTYAVDVHQILTGRNVFDDLFESGLVEPAHRDYSKEFLELVDEKGIDNPNRGRPVAYNAGGPDLFGYYWIDSDETGGPVFAWEDVSATGVDIVGDLDDDNYGGPYDLGFEFSYYDNIYTQIYIGSNGIIGFTPTTMYSRLKTPLPTAETPNNIIAWLWDDLDPTNGNNPDAHVYIYTDGNRCIIQFKDYPEYQADPGDVINAEIILESDGSIKLQYLSIAAGFDVASCAVGIENADGTDGLEVVYAADYLHDSLATLFVKPTEWLSLNKFSGLLPSGESDTITCKLLAEELDEGDYSATITIVSNDPDSMKNPWVIPVELTVSGTPPFICGDIDGSDGVPDIVDLIYLVNWMFNDGPIPPVLGAVDVDGSGGDPDVADLVYLVNFMFNSGPELICP